MEKEQDFFSKITPTNAGLILIAIGALLIIGAIRRWKWVLDMTGQRKDKPNLLLWLYKHFGEDGLRVGIIISSIFIIIGGICIIVLHL